VRALFLFLLVSRASTSLSRACVRDDPISFPQNAMFHVTSETSASDAVTFLALLLFFVFDRAQLFPTLHSRFHAQPWRVPRTDAPGTRTRGGPSVS